MIVLEPKSTAADNHFYGPSEADAEIDITGSNILQPVTSESQVWYFPFEGLFNATVNLPAGLLTFSGGDIDGLIQVPLKPAARPSAFTISGTPATSNYNGIVVQKGRKTIQH